MKSDSLAAAAITGLREAESAIRQLAGEEEMAKRLRLVAAAAVQVARETPPGNRTEHDWILIHALENVGYSI
jgi:hypothetical protein